ncbi:MAG: ADP-glyceromanno-heptose 6-epimerase [Deltaproteobacteria bacterium]|nr:ADP-glyceromanno-heptose 6-epimerase [Deltaproteobacteria bacterium]
MYIVTGGAGFIGSAFVSRLNAAGIDNILIVDELASSEKWKNLLGKSFVDYIHKDDFLKDLGAGKYTNQVRAIIHMGACSSTTERNVEFLMRNNYRYTVDLAEYALRHNIRFIYASSAATYGDGALGYSDENIVSPTLRPLNPYGFSKQLFDLWALRNDRHTKMVGIKFFNVFGPNEYHKEDMRSMVHKAYHQVKQTGQVRLFKSHRPDFKDGEQKRDFIYIKDCVEVLWWFLQNPSTNGIFNLGTGQARSWNDLVNAVFAALGERPRIEYVEMPIEIRNQYQYFTEADTKKLLRANPQQHFTSLEDAVKDYVTNYLEAGELTL